MNPPIALTLGRLALLLFVTVTPPARAATPVPDHLLYGTIAIDGHAVTRANTDTWIEARRTSSGPVIASHRMGANPRLGDFYYALRIPVAAADHATPLQAVLGESIVITVRANHGIAHQVVHQVTEPGVALRLDFGASIDTSGDGVPEGWERATLGTTGGNLSHDTDADGASDRAEYAAGTHPANASDVFRLAVQEDVAAIQVTFRALRASGVGFEGRTRFYALEVAPDPVIGPWRTVENLSRLPGGDQLVIHSQPRATSAPAFFRARVWLE